MRDSGVAGCAVKLCYCDESGTGDEPIATMVGVIVDAKRMHLTKAEWRGLLDAVSKLAGRQIPELHASDLYAGNGVFRGLDGPTRASIISATFKWLRLRKHQIVYSSVVKATYHADRRAQQIPDELNTLWRFMGFHLVLAVQKTHQREKNKKGHTFFVFDNEEREKMRFADLIARPPAWSDEYYVRAKKADQLDQAIDTSYFGDSREVSLIQVADLASFFLRRYAEIREGLVPPRYEAEEARVTGWVKDLMQSSVGRAAMYPKTGRGYAENIFYDRAPASVRDL